MLWLAFILPLGMIMWASLSKMVKKTTCFLASRDESKIRRNPNLTWHHIGSNVWKVTAIHSSICTIYGYKKKIIKVRCDIFYPKHQNQNKIVNMSTLTSCE